MILLRGTPSSDSSSQRTLLTPYRSGAGTPEEEEELALLQHLEQMRQQPQKIEYQQLPQNQQVHGAGEDLGGPAQAEEAQRQAGNWTPESAAASAPGWPQPRGPLPVEDDPPQGQVPAWQPGYHEGNAAEVEEGGGTPAAYPAHGSQEGDWGRHAAMGGGQDDPAWQPPEPGAGRDSHAWQSPQTMAPPAVPALPPSTPQRPAGRDQPPEVNESGAGGRPAPRPQAGGAAPALPPQAAAPAPGAAGKTPAPAPDEAGMVSTAKGMLKFVPPDKRLDFVKNIIDVRVAWMRGQKDRPNALRDWIATQAGFSKKIQGRLLDNYLAGAPEQTVRMSAQDVYDSGVQMNLEKFPEFQRELEKHFGPEPQEWKFKGAVKASADTTATLGTFTANLDLHVASWLETRDGKTRRRWKVSGSMTVHDIYNFDYTDPEATRAINDMCDGVEGGTYDGRPLSGQLKTILMSRVPGAAFRVTSEPVKIATEPDDPVARIHTPAGVYPPRVSIPEKYRASR